MSDIIDRMRSATPANWFVTMGEAVVEIESLRRRVATHESRDCDVAEKLKAATILADILERAPQDARHPGAPWLVFRQEIEMIGDKRIRDRFMASIGSRCKYGGKDAAGEA